MKLFALVHSGLEDIAQKEIKELVGLKCKVFPQVLELESISKKELLVLLSRGQSFRRLILGVEKFTSLEKIKLEETVFPWSDFFTNQLPFKIEVEGVSGQENRFAIARNIAGQIFSLLEKQALVPKMELKKPELLFLVFQNGKEYFLGVDLAGKELNSRSYRIFPHQASFKGDLAYALVRKSGYAPGEKMLVGFAKDGALPIEAALFAGKKKVHDGRNFSCHKFPFFREFEEIGEEPGRKNKKSQSQQSCGVFFNLARNQCRSRTAGYLTQARNEELRKIPEKIEIFAFDESTPNVVAAKKNLRLAGVKDLVDMQKRALDELDVRYEKSFFSVLIFHLTTKDEEKINEIYYQADYVLKPQGRMLLIARKNFELPLPSQFQLLQEEELRRGDSFLKLWLLEKK